MPRTSNYLLSTDRQILGLRPPVDGRERAQFRIKGAPGLVLRVTASGAKSWGLWLRDERQHRWRMLTLGRYPGMSLATAFAEWKRLGAEAGGDRDPFRVRDQDQSAQTLRFIGDAYIQRHARPKKRSWEADEQNLVREVYPLLGNARADQIKKGELVSLLNAIHDRGAPVQANRILALLRKMFNWAVAEGLLENTPAVGIPSRAKEHARTRVLEPSEIAALWRALNGGVFEETTADCLRLQFLLGARVREITGMRRSELDLGTAMPVWVLPGARAKAGRDVTRPLTPWALSIIRRRLDRSDKGPYVFASPADLSRPITARAPSNAVRRAGLAGRLLPTSPDNDRSAITAYVSLWTDAGFRPHDLRRTCRTYLAKLGVTETVAKKILGHSPARSDVTASVYDQHSYLPEMRAALEAWEHRLLRIVHENGVPREG